MKKNILQSLGPGLLFAGASIGVSHLVQSTRAGAEFGFGLLWALLIIHVFKYPFFQYGPRYAAATGETLLEGYQKIGKWVLPVYFLINFATMFTIQAAVTVVTAGLASQLFGISENPVLWSFVILLISIIFLAIGRYKLLDKVMKFIIILLAISTVTAVIIALNNSTYTFDVIQIIPSGSVEITFLIAFLGWMPAPLDVSIWHSIWSVEKRKQSKTALQPRDAIFDFNVGYIGTLVLGICFVLLGALVMYKSSATFSNKGGEFAAQLIELYTQNLGDFSYIFIAAAAFTTMFSTTITTLDASPRAMQISSELIVKKEFKFGYQFWILLLFLGTLGILQFYITNMGDLVKIATILSFLTAPFYAILNFILITGKETPKEYQPNIITKILSLLGIVFLIGFSIWFLMNI